MPGSDSIVTNTEGHVDEAAAGMAGGQNLLGDRFNQVFEITDEVRPLVDGYLEQFSSLLESVAVPDGAADEIGDVVIADVQGVDFTSFEAPGSSSLPGFENIIFPFAPVLKSPPAVDTSYTEPTQPAEVNPVLGYTETPYTSDMWLDLFTKVHDGVINGGTGLSEDVEDAIFERGKRRVSSENEEAYLASLRSAGGRGIKYPGLIVRTIEAESASKVADRHQDIIRDIMIKQAELAQTNTHFMLDKAGALEQILRTFHVSYQTLTLEAKKAAAQLILQNYAEKNKGFIAQYDGIKTKMEAQRTAVDAVLAENTTIKELYEIQVNSKTAEAELIAKERDSLVTADKSRADIYKAKVQAQSEIYRALTENQKAELERSRLKLEQAVQKVNATLNKSLEINKLREKILEAMSNIAAQVLASALNAVNASIGHSTSATESRGESWSHSDGISSNHSTEHDPSS